MKRQVEVIRVLKTGGLSIRFESCPLLKYYDFRLRYMSFSPFALDNFGCFYSSLSKGLLWKGPE